MKCTYFLYDLIECNVCLSMYVRMYACITVWYAMYGYHGCMTRMYLMGDCYLSKLCMYVMCLIYVCIF